MQTVKPRVTVYLVNYNYSQFLTKALLSCIQQSYNNIELLVYDDGSSDDSILLIKRLQKKYDFFFFQTPNIGLNKIVSHALVQSTGDFIIRLDSDDWFADNTIEKLVQRISSDDDIALVFPDYYEVDIEGNILCRVKRHNFDNSVSILDQPAHGACTLVRKKFLLSVKSFGSNYSRQDGVDVWIALSRKFKVTNINEPLFFYRKHGNSLSDNKISLLKTRHDIFKDHFYYSFSSSLNNFFFTAYIPIREKKIENLQFEFLKIDGKYIIDLIIQKLCTSNFIKSIIIHSSECDIYNYLVTKYTNLHFIHHYRSKRFSSSGVNICDGLLADNALLNKITTNYLCILTTEYPIYLNNYIDTALYAMALFNSKCVDCVVETTSLYYEHDGHGLKPYQDALIKEESKQLFKRSGGITLIDVDHLVLQKKLITNKMGHVIIDFYSSLNFRNINDLEIFSSLLTSFKNE